MCLLIVALIVALPNAQLGDGLLADLWQRIFFLLPVDCWHPLQVHTLSLSESPPNRLALSAVLLALQLAVIQQHYWWIAARYSQLQHHLGSDT